MAQYRVLLSSGGKDEGIGGTWDGLKEACKDPFTWYVHSLLLSYPQRYFLSKMRAND